MKTIRSDLPLSTNTIKGLDPLDQVAALRKLMPQYLIRAAAIRGALEISPHGIVNICIEGSNEKVVLLSLLTAVLDDIGTVPDSKRVSELLASHEQVALELGFDKADVQFFRRNRGLVLEALFG